MLSYILGIDIGTGSTKGVAVEQSGRVLATAQAFYPEGTSHSEQDPELIWKAFVKVVHDAVQQLKAAPAAVTLSSAMHSIIAVDDAGNPLSPVLTWADDRAAAIAEELLAQPLGKSLYEACGTAIHALSPLCKIVWWQKNDPALVQRTHKFIGIKEWIWHRLFGLFEVDYSIATATGMLSLKTLDWHQPAVRFAGIDTAKLSAPVSPMHRRNTLLPDAVAALGLPPTTPFVIGGSDGCLANLGTGSLMPGVAAATIGTSGAVRVACNCPCPQWPEQLFNYYLDENVWITGGAINNGGAAVSWSADLLYDGLKNIPLNELTQIPAGSEGLLFLPFLLGERAPIWDSNSSAAFIGLRQQHTQLHLLKATLEGVCFALRSVLAPLESASGPIEQLHLSGGFSQSAEALQILADCVGKKIVRLQTSDASAIGAAYLGFKAMAWITDFRELPFPVTAETILPNEENHRRYNELFRIYQNLYPTLKDAMHQLRAFN